jgi:hypothetical protein
MMRGFMTLGSLTWDAEHDEGLDGSNMMPFLWENTVLMVYERRPHWAGAAYIYIYIYVKMYITVISRGKRKEKGKTMRQTTQSHGRGRGPSLV